MNREDPVDISKSLTNNSLSLTANVEALEAENYDKDENNKKRKSLVETTRKSKKYNEDDLKEHTRVTIDLKSALDDALSNITQYNEIEEGFLDKHEGMIFIFIGFLGVCLSPLMLRGNNMLYTFIASAILLFISIFYKVIKHKNRKKKKLEILNKFKENRRKIKYLLNRKNQVQTYICISYNSMYRRTFNPKLYKLLRDEIGNQNIKDELKINYTVWKEFSQEINRGMKQSQF